MLMRIADWHGEQAALHYMRWQRTESEDDLRNYSRHASLADRMWHALRLKRKTF